jgi:hypothetical protein
MSICYQCGLPAEGMCRLCGKFLCAKHTAPGHIVRCEHCYTSAQQRALFVIPVLLIIFFLLIALLLTQMFSKPFAPIIIPKPQKPPVMDTS